MKNHTMNICAIGTAILLSAGFARAQSAQVPSSSSTATRAGDKCGDPSRQ